MPLVFWKLLRLNRSSARCTECLWSPTRTSAPRSVLKHQRGLRTSSTLCAPAISCCGSQEFAPGCRRRRKHKISLCSCKSTATWPWPLATRRALCKFRGWQVRCSELFATPVGAHREGAGDEVGGTGVVVGLSARPHSFHLPPSRTNFSSTVESI